MKKKIITLALIATLALSACGHSKPEHMSQDVYDLGVSAVESLESYMDGDISLDDLKKKIDRISDQLDRLPEADETAEKVQAGAISTDLTVIAVDLLSDGIAQTGEDLGLDISGSSDLRKDIDELKKDLNMK